VAVLRCLISYLVLGVRTCLVHQQEQHARLPCMHAFGLTDEGWRRTGAHDTMTAETSGVLLHIGVRAMEEGRGWVASLRHIVFVGTAH